MNLDRKASHFFQPCLLDSIHLLPGYFEVLKRRNTLDELNSSFFFIHQQP